MLSRDQFDTEIALLRTALEARRKKYLRYYYTGMGAGLLLLGSAFFCPEATLHAIQKLASAPAPLKVSDIWAYRLFTLLCFACLTLGPVRSYRGERGAFVERAILTRILGHFGNFTPMPGGGMRAPDIRKTELFSDLLFYPEEGAMGEIGGVRVRLCTAVLLRREETRDLPVFHGLFILCESAGITGNLDKAATDAILTRLSAAAKASALKAPRWDEAFLYAASALYARAKRLAVSRMGKDELPSEKAYRLKYAVQPPLARVAMPAGAAAVFDPYVFECSPQRCVAAVAGFGALFTLGSLFDRALSPAHAESLYEAMKGASALALQCNEIR